MDDPKIFKSDNTQPLGDDAQILPGETPTPVFPKKNFQKLVEGDLKEEEEDTSTAPSIFDMPKQKKVGSFIRKDIPLEDKPKREVAFGRKDAPPSELPLQRKPGSSHSISFEYSNEATPDISGLEEKPEEKEEVVAPTGVGFAIPGTTPLVTQETPLEPKDSRELFVRTVHEAITDWHRSLSSKKEFSTEQPDIAGVPQATQQQPFVPVVPVAEQEIQPSIQTLVTKLVEEIQLVRTEGKTDTVVTLKQPPMFEGAHIVLTSFDSARGEFNIAFHDLTPVAQQILQSHQVELQRGLEQKGYTMHIIVITTAPIENRIASKEEGNSGEKEGRGQGGGGQQQQPRDQRQQGQS